MSDLDRRELVTAAATLALGACSRGTAGEPDPAPAPPARAREPGVVRVASVRTAVDGALLPALVERFERASSHRVRVSTGENVYDLARAGAVDLVISHYGHKDAEQFVVDGLGEFPRMIFSNQMALLGPAGDPAGVRGLPDLGDAFAKIAAARAPYLMNDLDGVHYLTEIAWHAAGKPARAGWWIDDGTSKDAAIERAAKLGAYVLWGLTPFLRLDAAMQLGLEPLVLGDPLLQRMLVAIVVKPAAPEATAFQSFLLAPETQAAIRVVRYPGQTVVHWVPAGRHNRTAVLPRG